MVRRRGRRAALNPPPRGRSLPAQTGPIPPDFSELPDRWYNILPDLPEPLPPPADPESGPSRLAQLPNLLIRTCLEQELSDQRWIAIPDGVRQLYLRAGRPRPLFR